MNTNVVGTIIGRWWINQFDAKNNPHWKLVDLVNNFVSTLSSNTLHQIDILQGKIHAKTHLHRDGVDGGHVLLPFASKYIEINDELITNSGEVTYPIDNSMWSCFTFVFRDEPRVNKLTLSNPSVRSVGSPLFLEFENRSTYS